MWPSTHQASSPAHHCREVIRHTKQQLRSSILGKVGTKTRACDCRASCGQKVVCLSLESLDRAPQLILPPQDLLPGKPRLGQHRRAPNLPGCGPPYKSCICLCQPGACPSRLPYCFRLLKTVCLPISAMCHLLEGLVIGSLLQYLKKQRQRQAPLVSPYMCPHAQAGSAGSHNIPGSTCICTFYKEQKEQ